MVTIECNGKPLKAIIREDVVTAMVVFAFSLRRHFENAERQEQAPRWELVAYALDGKPHPTAHSRQASPDDNEFDRVWPPNRLEPPLHMHLPRAFQRLQHMLRITRPQAAFGVPV